MSRYWSSLLEGLTPYVAGEQPRDRKYIKLNTNENPYPPSPHVIEKIKELASSDLRLYPDPEALELRESIASYYGIQKENVFVGNGSDEVLALAFMAFFLKDSPLLFPDITYSFYPVYCDLFGITYETVPLTKDFEIDTSLYSSDKAGIIFPNPNAPTGRALPLENIEKLLNHNPDTPIAIDEAYVDFGAESAVKLIGSHDNLLVIQTFSKSRSLAGLRTGFAVGSGELIEGLNMVKNSFNSYPLDRLAIGGAAQAVKDEDYFIKCRDMIIETREQTSSRLKNFGFTVIPSKANFIMTSHPEVRGKELYEKLKEQGILVRHFDKPGINEFIRVTIGTEEEMNIFMDRVGDIIKTLK